RGARRRILSYGVAGGAGVTLAVRRCRWSLTHPLARFTHGEWYTLTLPSRGGSRGPVPLTPPPGQVLPAAPGSTLTSPPGPAPAHAPGAPCLPRPPAPQPVDRRRRRAAAAGGAPASYSSSPPSGKP